MTNLMVEPLRKPDFLALTRAEAAAVLDGLEAALGAARGLGVEDRDLEALAADLREAIGRSAGLEAGG
jgi:hypothetical protein